MKQNLTIALLIAAVIAVGILLYFLLHQGKQYDSHNEGHEQAQADLRIIRQQRDSGLKVIDSLQKMIRQGDTAKAQLKSELAGTRRDLDKSTVKAIQLAKDIITLQEKQKDTTEQGRKCDSLAGEALNFAFLYNQYKANSDSLAIVVDKQSADYSTTLNEQKWLYNELYAKYEQLSKLYDNLFKDYTGARKSLKRERLKTKIAALLALIGGAAAIVK